jgi:hypothetical protein
MQILIKHLKTSRKFGVLTYKFSHNAWVTGSTQLFPLDLNVTENSMSIITLYMNSRFLFYKYVQYFLKY